MFKFVRATALALFATATGFAATGLTVSSAQAGSVTIYDASAPTCREFTSTINVGNILQQGVGTACLQGDGSWQIVAGPGVGTSFYDNGIPVAYPANSYYTTQNVYYQQPVRVRYIFDGPRNYYRAPPVVVTQIGPGWGRGGWDRRWDGAGRPYHGWDNNRHGDWHHHR